MMKLTIVLLAGAACLMPMMAVAQNGPGCAGRCETQYDTCHAGAEAALTECLDRAKDARDKVLCAVAFTKLEDACRATESGCLSNCPAD
jgi:hypothetical protein